MAAILVGGQDVETFQFNAALACLGMRQGVGTGGQVADHIAAIHQQPDRTARVGQLGALGDAAVVAMAMADSASTSARVARRICNDMVGPALERGAV
ncbi:hypothetical protein G6F22_012217 [Rhizopus arrhizus]|nr:hypothetical protein G6F22_012217 [Rhizopus arrhizus]KAG1389431.1 hypothetical protein G6F58_013281 [Rhizopus delemar]